MMTAMGVSALEDFDVLVVGAGPAGVVAALRAARLGARTALVTRDALGGMAATDGPVPVRTLAHAARLIREARQLPGFGISVGELSLCKLIVDRQTHTILGCHIVGERAVELAQVAAVAMAASQQVEQLALVPFSFPTYANALGRAALRATQQLDLPAGWAADPLAHSG